MLTPEVRKELQAHIHTTAQAWANTYIAQRRSVLTRRKYRHTGDLGDSLAAIVTDVFGDAVTNTLELGFWEYGRWIDMRNLSPAGGGEQYLNELAKWIQDKGLYSKLLAGYLERRQLVQADKNALQNIAFAIARSRAAKTPRQRGWYAKSSQGAINTLYNDIAAGLPDIVIEQLKAQFSNP